MFNLQNEPTKNLQGILIQKPFRIFVISVCVCVPRSCEWFKRKYCENAQEIPPRLINLSIHNRKTHFIRIYCKTRKSEIFSPHKRAGHGRSAPLWATAPIFVIHTFSNQWNLVGKSHYFQKFIFQFCCLQSGPWPGVW